MWKLIVGFAVFAGLALWMLSKGGDIDIGGEKHGDESMKVPAATAPAAEPTKPASAP